MRPKIATFNQKKRIAWFWLLAALFVAALLLVKPYWHEGPVHEAIEDTGLILVFFAILGRLWSILYIGAHKNRHLVEIGPYSMTRNPLYLSSLLGILGVGLMFGSLVVAIVMTAAFYAVFRYTVRREAEFLLATFGKAYADYAARTPLFIPDPRLYRKARTTTFSQKALTSTFLDSLLLLALFPVIEGIEHLRASGHLPHVATLF